MSTYLYYLRLKSHHNEGTVLMRCNASPAAEFGDRKGLGLTSSEDYLKFLQLIALFLTGKTQWHTLVAMHVLSLSVMLFSVRSSFESCKVMVHREHFPLVQWDFPLFILQPPYN